MARTGVTIGFTVLGAAAGAYFGNPMLGAQLGMMVGSIAGALLFPGGEDQKGPRLGDLRVGDASYGIPIPIVYGTARVAGTMIWTSGLEERSNEESLKGGGPTSTTYTYYSSFAMGLCEGPLASVRKIWLDTKLVYDVSAGNLGIVNQRLGELDPRHLLTEDELEDRRDEIQAQLNKVSSALTIYLGTETQLPDPTMEAHEGVGNVPAHRGLAYLLFQDLALEAYGNRIPNISAEVMTQHTMAYPKRSVNPGVTINKDKMVLDPARQILWGTQEQTITQIDAITNTLVRAATLDPVSDSGGTISPTLELGFDVDQDGALYLALDEGVAARLARLDAVSMQVTHRNLDNLGLPTLLSPCSAIRCSPGYVWYTSFVTPRGYCFLRPGAINPQDGLPIAFMLQTGVLEFEQIAQGLIGHTIAIDRDETAWIICSGHVELGEPSLLVHMTPIGLYDVFDLTADIKAATLVTYDALTHSLLIGGLASVTTFVRRVARFDIATGTVTAHADGVINTTYVQSAWRQGIQGRRLWFPADATTFAALDVDSLTLVREESTASSPGFVGNNFFGGLYDAATNAMWVVEAGAGFTKYFLDRLEVEPVTLGGIVEDLSLRAGLTAAEVQTASLTAPVHGFVVSHRAEARASLEPLLAAFLADGVESDWSLIFDTRARAPVATLTVADLAAHEPGSTLPDVLTPERLDDQQLPIRLDITYADPARDYQDTVQHARRFQAGQRARSLREVRVPVILSADQARQLAEQSLHEAWVSRTSYKLLAPYRWTTLDPGDVITIDQAGSTSLMRLQQVQNGANGILDITAVAYDRHIYTASRSVGAVADALTAQTLTMLAPTGLFLLDTHLLRDVDEGSGYYLAMAPQGGGDWHGATAFSSVDGNAWRMEDTLTSAVDYGSTLTPLGVGSPYVIDYGHMVDVRMARGALSSISEAELINGFNAALLGNEIVQWQTATPLDATSWRLSHLLRGRRGTEWAIPEHTAGERFIVLHTAALRREQMGLSEVGTTRVYRAVTMNTDMLTTTGQAFVNTALGLKCYSVEHVHGTRNTSNDLTITWVRRTRLGGLWVDGRDVALGEFTGEQYEVDILSGGMVVRTIHSTSPTALYLASEQTTDGLTPGSPVTLTVSQLGQLGRGWPTTATL
jgi:hypothetical protein